MLGGKAAELEIVKRERLSCGYGKGELSTRQDKDPLVVHGGRSCIDNDTRISSNTLLMHNSG